MLLTLRRFYFRKLVTFTIIFISLVLVFLIICKAFHSEVKNSTLQKRITESKCDPSAMASMKDRIYRLQNFCESYHLGNFQHSNGDNDLKVKEPPTPQYSYFFLNREKRLAWCPVYKAGSTSWLHNMMLIAGVSVGALKDPLKQLSIWAREIYGDPVPGQDFDSAQKMLIVRHPFRRILSAYLDKLSNSTTGGQHGTAHFYDKYGRHIVRNFRKGEFIVQREPTFEEFVQYLISMDLILYSDDHWLPVYYSCTPCRVNYSYIAKVKTLTRDQNCIIQDTGLGSILTPKWKHETPFPDSDALVSKYFSQLSKFQITELYKKYKLDFLLFGYSYSSYLKFAKS